MKDQVHKIGPINVRIEGYEPTESKKTKKLTKKVEIKQKNAEAFSFQIVGMEYQIKGIFNIKKVLQDMRPGMPVRIEHEVENKYDSNALAIYFGDTKVGYVPRAYNQEILNLAKKKKTLIFLIERSSDLKDYYDYSTRPTISVICVE